MGKGVGRKKRIRMITMYGRTCWICGSLIKALVTADHVIPRSKGGTDAYENLRPAHKRCNKDRGNADVPPMRYGVVLG